ncbi:hypothetical protein Salat_1665500 [Sesamum alatum]|uniref:Uncharacterized protein n=1 Tax=Sesamum alatum TaxID=300844 RepID=A0AAE1Y6Q4_9LAMI|nr:hypothetical protein Salat_1665500 [Sesamum alatum]
MLMWTSFPASPWKAGTPPITVVVLEKYEKMRKSFKPMLDKSRSELLTRRTQIQEKDQKLALQSLEYEVLKVSSAQAYSKDREEGLATGQASAISAFKMSVEYVDELFRQGSSFYVDGFTTCPNQFRNLRDLPSDFDFGFLDVQADGMGRIEVIGPSEDVGPSNDVGPSGGT